MTNPGNSPFHHFDLTPREGQPCEECGYVPADPYSGLCERCLFGPLDDDDLQPAREALDA